MAVKIAFVSFDSRSSKPGCHRSDGNGAHRLLRTCLLPSRRTGTSDSFPPASLSSSKHTLEPAAILTWRSVTRTAFHLTGHKEARTEVKWEGLGLRQREGPGRKKASPVR